MGRGLGWSKGLSKDTDEGIRKMSESRKGQSPWNKNKKGVQTCWSKGKTKETSSGLASLSEKQKGRRNSFLKKHPEGFSYLTPEERKKKFTSLGHLGKKHSPESIRKNRDKNSETISRKIANGEIKGDGWAKHGEYVTKKGIIENYDSSYELERFKELDNLGYFFTKKHGIRISYIKKNGDSSYYIPDILVIDSEDNSIWLEEIKSSYTQNSDSEFCNKVEAAKEWASKSGIDYIVLCRDYDVAELVWDEIVEIEEVGEDEYYGIIVPNYHNYFLQGFINHNSGKDFCSGICIARIMYQLLCKKCPQKEFNQSEDSFIDAINIAVNANQASHVFFQPFRNMINRAKIFRKFGFDDKLNEIIFPKNLRAISGHSHQEGLEGYTPIIAILDEIAAFPIADDMSGSKILHVRDANVIYNAIRASVQSRFPGVGKIVSLSFPRYKGDFIMSLAEKRKDDPKTFVSAGIPTWIANPTKKREDFNDEYSKNPEIARGKYECIPPDSDEPYLRDQYLVKSLFLQNQYASGYEAFLNITPEPFTKYCMHIDLGLKHDSAGISMAHSVENNEIMVDFAFAVIPSGLSQEVSFSEIRQMIFSLKDRGFSLTLVTLDHFASEDTIQILKQNRIACDTLSVDRNTSVYDTLKELIYTHRIIFRFVEPILLKELLGLRMIRASKVEHLPGLSKDVSDAVAGSVYNAVQFPRIRAHRTLGDINTIFNSEKLKVDPVTAWKVPVEPKRLFKPGICRWCGKAGYFEDIGPGEKRCNYCLTSFSV